MGTGPSHALIEWDAAAMPSRIGKPRNAAQRREVGRALQVARECLEHGEFSTWLRRVAQLSARSARRFMAEAEEHDRPAVERSGRCPKLEVITVPLKDEAAPQTAPAPQLQTAPVLEAKTAPNPDERPQPASRATRTATKFDPAMLPDLTKLAATFMGAVGEDWSNFFEDVLTGKEKLIAAMTSEEPRARVRDAREIFGGMADALRLRLTAIEEAAAYLEGQDPDAMLWFAGNCASWVREHRSEPGFVKFIENCDFDVFRRHAEVERAYMAAVDAGALRFLPSDVPWWPVDDIEVGAFCRVALGSIWADATGAKTPALDGAADAIYRVFLEDMREESNLSDRARASSTSGGARGEQAAQPILKLHSRRAN